MNRQLTRMVKPFFIYRTGKDLKINQASMSFFEVDTLIPHWKNYKYNILGEQFDSLNLQPFKS